MQEKEKSGQLPLPNQLTSRVKYPHLALLEDGEELLAGVLEEGGPDLAALVVQQVDAEQRALALGVGPPPDVRLGCDACLDRPAEEVDMVASGEESQEQREDRRTKVVEGAYRLE